MTAQTGDHTRELLLDRADPASARTLRREVAVTAHRWGYAELAPTAALLASELYANALRHSTTPRIEAVLAQNAGGFLIEVYDNSPAPPASGLAGPKDEAGRGLMLVRAWATEWGWRALDPGRKVVWCWLKPGESR